MINRRPRKTPEQWKSIVSDFEASGQHIDQFCQLNDIAPVTLQKWRRRFSESGSKKTKPAFTQIAPPESIAASDSSESIRLEIGSSIRLTIEHHG